MRITCALNTSGVTRSKASESLYSIIKPARYICIPLHRRFLLNWKARQLALPMLNRSFTTLSYDVHCQNSSYHSSDRCISPAVPCMTCGRGASTKALYFSSPLIGRRNMWVPLAIIQRPILSSGTRPSRGVGRVPPAMPSRP